MKHPGIKISVFLNYFIFAILLNSVGTVMLQVQRFFGATQSQASVLEACKDFSIAIVSFLVASFVVRIGYKRSMLVALGLMALTCFSIPFVETFLSIKLLFMMIGASFGITKVSVYGIVGLITEDDKEHLSLMNFLESFFMIGVLSGYFIFSHFINDSDPHSVSWFRTYYVLGGLLVIAFLLLSGSSLNENSIKQEEHKGLSGDFTAMLRLLLLPLVASFIVCAFLYVLIEQSIMSWLPTFNNKVLHIPSSFSVLIAGILAAATALGRFAAGVVLKKFNWYYVLIACLLAAATLVLIALPLANGLSPKEITGWVDIPVAAYVFPLIGFFLAPIYPAINSVILASLPKNRHAAMSGLIVVFSALGGTLGSICTGYIFQHFGGQMAFYFSLAPVTLLIIALTIYKGLKVKMPPAVAIGEVEINH